MQSRPEGGSVFYALILCKFITSGFYDRKAIGSEIPTVYHIDTFLA